MVFHNCLLKGLKMSSNRIFALYALCMALVFSMIANLGMYNSIKSYELLTNLQNGRIAQLVEVNTKLAQERMELEVKNARHEYALSVALIPEATVGEAFTNHMAKPVKKSANDIQTAVVTKTSEFWNYLTK